MIARRLESNTPHPAFLAQSLLWGEGMPAHTRTARRQIALWLIHASLLAFALQLGGALYEHLVIDTAWLKNPVLIQPDRGGIDRKLFWIPVHAVSTVLLLGALWAVWYNRSARRYVLVAVGLYLAVRLWTLAYFIPLALSFEAPRNLSPDMMDQAKQWALLSLLRLPFVIGSTLTLYLAARRMAVRTEAASRGPADSDQKWVASSPPITGG